jgi:hypothetical protein
MSHYKINDSGKAELHIGYEAYKALPADIVKEIKTYFLFSRSRSAWISKGKADSASVKNVIELLKLQPEGKLEQGTEVEKEHQETIEKIASGEIPASKAAEAIAKDHLEEDPEYYKKLETIEQNDFKVKDRVVVKENYLTTVAGTKGVIVKTWSDKKGQVFVKLNLGENQTGQPLYNTYPIYVIEHDNTDTNPAAAGAGGGAAERTEKNQDVDTSSQIKNVFTQTIDTMILKETHKIFVGQKVFYKPNNLNLTIDSWDEVDVKLKRKPIFRDEEPKPKTWLWQDIIDLFWAEEITIEGFEPSEKAEFSYLVRGVIFQIQIDKKDAEITSKNNELESTKIQIQSEILRINSEKDAELKVKLIQERLSVLTDQMQESKGKKKDEIFERIQVLEEMLNEIQK